MRTGSWFDRFRMKHDLRELTDLEGWRNYYFDLLLRLAPILLAAALVVTIPSLISEGHPEIIAFDIGGIVLFLLIMVLVRDPLPRGVILILSLACLIVVFFISLGPLYARPGWLVLSCVAAALLLGVRAALALTGFIAVTQMLLYLYVGPHLDSWAPVYTAPLGTWIGFVWNISLVSLAASVPVGILLKRLSISFSREIDLRKKILAESEALKVTNAALEHEIAERRLAEEALRLSDERFNQVAANAGEWIWEVDAQGLYVYCSDAVERIMGYRPDELVGRKYFYDLFSADIRQELKEAIFRGFIVKAPFRDFVNANIHKDGRLVILETSGTPIVDAEGNLLGYRGADTDVTERRQVEEALRRSEERFRSVFDAMTEGVCIHRLIYDESGGAVNYEIVDVNPKYEKILGVKREDVVGRLVTDAFPVPRPPFLEEYAGVVQTGLPYAFETYYPAWNRHFHVSVCSLGGGQFANTFFEITDRKNLETQLMHAQKMEAIGTLAGGIAHDFNNILGGIMGFTELVMTRYIQPDHPAHAHLQESFRGAVRARDLVAQIMTLSRSGEQARQPMEIAPIAKEAMKLLRASLPATIEIRWHINTAAKKVLANPTQIHQILMNLCTNAAQAMKEKGGVLGVSLETVVFGAEDAVPSPRLTRGVEYERLTVSDTGHGIGRDIITRIFDPFFTTKKQGEGTGLGLAVVYGIVVKKLDGALEVESERGRGTTFKIYIPATAERTEEKGRDESAPIPGGTERILFVDDEKVLTNIFKIQLQDLGYRVDIYNDPVEAVDAFGHDPASCDLVVTDMTMPHMTGVELAGTMKRLRPDIPVILSSGTLDTIDPSLLKQSGIDNVIRKPITIKDMAVTIRQVLDSR